MNNNVEYYKDNSSVIFKKTIHNTEFDSVYYFYDNGLLFKKGKQYQENQKFGIWKLYDRESKLREIREWFTINGKSRINRVWHLNNNGDTLAWRHQDSIFNQTEFINDTVRFRNTVYDLIYFNSDTIINNEPLKANVYVRSKAIRKYPSHVRVLVGKEKYNYNFDFSNERDVKLDTFYDLTFDTINQKWFKKLNSNEVAVFGRWFDSTGEKVIRGYYQEYSFGPFVENEDGEKLDSVIGYKTYFERKIYVKDSIK